MTVYAKTRSRLAAVVVRRDTKAGLAFDYAVQFLVLTALAVFSIGTLPDLDPADRRWLEMAEMVILAVFTFEYVLRIWVSENRWGYVFSFFGIVDLVAILPVFWFAKGTTDLVFVRSFRLLRLLLIIKAVQSTEAVSRLKQAWEQIRDELMLYGAASVIVLFTAAAGIHHFEHKAQPEAFKSVFHSLWWAITTLASVEYGDVYPITTGGKIFTFFVAVTGLGVVAVPTALLASALTKTKRPENP